MKNHRAIMCNHNCGAFDRNDLQAREPYDMRSSKMIIVFGRCIQNFFIQYKRSLVSKIILGSSCKNN